ncbi:M56 family metallopeptidase [Actinomadura violacea]|uniref:M48 family metalloprotease n=1 Tax=Actinomadura violacea TaxID=2819934 RepID=A0ABS3RLT8_9ACTN|nr:M48 family metalloprotease [Actinomadura violacea]MBO2457709.1 M48 family metalloprotease [Actinomadura violacea]
MDLDGLLPLVLPAVMALAARPLSGRLPPRTATWLLTGTAVVLALASTATLAVLALGGALRLPVIAALGHLSEHVLHRDPQTSPLVATVAGPALVASLGAAGCAAVQRVRALLAGAKAARELPGGGIVAVVEDEGADAFALPGRPGRVVVSTGMLSILDEAERRVLLAHERAHLAGRHHWFRALVHVATAANPLLWPLRGAVTFTTERWADERAAAGADRERAARAIGKAALAHNGRPGLGHAAALGIGRVAGLGRRRPGPLPRRVAALLAPPLPHRRWLVVATAALVVLSVWAANDGVLDLHQLIEHAQTR